MGGPSRTHWSVNTVGLYAAAAKSRGNSLTWRDAPNSWSSDRTVKADDGRPAIQQADNGDHWALGLGRGCRWLEEERVCVAGIREKRL